MMNKPDPKGSRSKLQSLVKSHTSWFEVHGEHEPAHQAKETNVCIETSQHNFIYCFRSKILIVIYCVKIYHYLLQV